MSGEEIYNKNIPAINRSLDAIAKQIDKLKSLGVMSNFTYCIPPTGTLYSRGTWTAMKQLIMTSFSKTNFADFNKNVKHDMDNLASQANENQPTPILGTLPDAKSSRDELKPIVTEMVRISQAKGMFNICVIILQQNKSISLL